MQLKNIVMTKTKKLEALRAIKKWLKEHYKIEQLVITEENDKFFVSAENVTAKYEWSTETENHNTLNNNGMFEWTENINCFNCERANVKNLIGAPKKCVTFECSKFINSLEGAPEECEDFYCNSFSKLVNLKGAPKKCENFDCCHVNIKSLEGAPEECKKFDCCSTGITNLLGAPKKCEEFYCGHCNILETLEGAPKECKIFNCCNNYRLKSLEGAPEKCETFYCGYCEILKSLENAPKICQNFICNNCEELKSLDGAPANCLYFSAENCRNITKNDILTHVNIEKYNNNLIKVIAKEIDFGGSYVKNEKIVLIPKNAIYQKVKTSEGYNIYLDHNFGIDAGLYFDYILPGKKELKERKNKLNDKINQLKNEIERMKKEIELIETK